MSSHAVNGFPVYPGWQMHMGACLTVVHVAWLPQAPGQGSTQRSFWQARFPGQSSLIVHSGRQLGARPIYPGKQEHAGVFPMTRHWAFGPQGDGTQGLPEGSGGAWGSKEKRNRAEHAESCRCWMILKLCFPFRMLSILKCLSGSGHSTPDHVLSYLLSRLRTAYFLICFRLQVAHYKTLEPFSTLKTLG